MNEKVSILMSIYRPDPVFLEKQILSLTAQTYENKELVIWNDDPGSPLCDGDFDVYRDLIQIRYYPCAQNLGYCQAFEKLTVLGGGDYFAYCDQDDIWLPEKLTVSVAALQKEKALLVASDYAIIDKNDQITELSYRHSSRLPQICWNTGDDITKYAAFTCYGHGMTLVMDAQFAKSCVPFGRFAHDNWLTLCAAQCGKCVFLDQVLQQYRIHGKNISAIMAGVHSKADYYRTRVDERGHLIHQFLEKYPDCKDRLEIERFQQAREKRDSLYLLNHREMMWQIAPWEALLPFLPDWLFRFLVKKIFHSK